MDDLLPRLRKTSYIHSSGPSIHAGRMKLTMHAKRKSRVSSPKPELYAGTAYDRGGCETGNHQRKSMAMRMKVRLYSQKMGTRKHDLSFQGSCGKIPNGTGHVICAKGVINMLVDSWKATRYTCSVRYQCYRHINHDKRWQLLFPFELPTLLLVTPSYQRYRSIIMLNEQYWPGIVG